MQRGLLPGLATRQDQRCRKADARPGRAAGRCPLGPWAAARRCSQRQRCSTQSLPRRSTAGEASSQTRPRLPGWQPSVPWSRASRLTEPQRTPPGCLLTTSPGMRATLPPASLGSGPGSPAPGPRTRPRLVTRMRPGLQAKALCPTCRRAGHGAAGAEVAVWASARSAFPLLFLVALVLAFHRLIRMLFHRYA